MQAIAVWLIAWREEVGEMHTAYLVITLMLALMVSHSGGKIWRDPFQVRGMCCKFKALNIVRSGAGFRGRYLLHAGDSLGPRGFGSRHGRPPARQRKRCSHLTGAARRTHGQGCIGKGRRPAFSGAAERT